MSSVYLARHGVIGELVLDNPATLNALTHADINAFRAGLEAHEADSKIKAIVVRSSSQKAFCAGGDMKHIRKLAIAGQRADIAAYFRDEYALNLAISRCSKPYIALLDGFAMGGGLGISIHGRFRIITERSVLAMPETRIGFFPDVGASYFLPRLPHRAGWWLGLTSMSVHGHEAVDVGLGTHFVISEQLNTLRDALNESLGTTATNDEHTLNQCVVRCIEGFVAQPTDNSYDDILRQRASWFASEDITTIQSNLQHHADAGVDDASQLLKLMQTGSPHALRLSVQLLSDARNKPLDQCLQLELQLAPDAAMHPDCIEGIRAVLVDKDRNPDWQTA